jgi:hypothetical protein
LYVLTELKDFKLLLQKLVLEKTFGHILLQGFLPEYQLKDLQAMKHNQLIVGNINSRMTLHFIGVHPSHSLRYSLYPSIISEPWEQ